MTFMIVAIDSDDSSAEELEEACRTLADDLLEVPELKIGRVVDPTPQTGTRSLAPDVGMALFISLLSARAGARAAASSPRVEAISKAITKVFQVWLERNKGRKVEITSADGTSLTMSGNFNGDETSLVLQQWLTQSAPGPEKEQITLPEEKAQVSLPED